MRTVSERRVFEYQGVGNAAINPAVCVRNITDYSPFGVSLDGRTIESDGYRYGYQSSERDDETKGKGNSYTTFFRQLDPRVGRWLSLDPKSNNYPNESPYVAFHNNPIYWTDPFGDSPPDLKELFKIMSNSKTFLKVAASTNISEFSIESIVSYDNQTATNPSNGKITLLSYGSENAAIRGMAHEATNRKNLKQLQEACVDARWGLIKPIEYAKIILNVEIEATVNQIIVLSELNLKFEGEGSDFFNPLLEGYSKGELSKKDLTKTIKANILEAVGENGTKHLDTYINDAIDMYKSTENIRKHLVGQKSIESRAKKEKKQLSIARKKAGIK